MTRPSKDFTDSDLEALRLLETAWRQYADYLALSQVAHPGQLSKAADETWEHRPDLPLSLVVRVDDRGRFGKA
jgi:hypothetical protein